MLDYFIDLYDLILSMTKLADEKSRAVDSRNNKVEALKYISTLTLLYGLYQMRL